jgi:tripartite ATP-independent transporter DctM subunit
MLVVFAAGLPVAFALGGVAMILAVILWGPQSFGIIATSAVSSLDSFLLMSVPLFIFMGKLLETSGAGDAMFRAVHLWAGRLRGGLAIGAVLICTLMAAMVGVIGAGIMTVGTVAIPAMLKRGYDKFMSFGSIMAGGALGMLIPPSVNMIVYSSITKVSIGKMFAGGIIPGLLLAGLYMAYIAVRCWRDPKMGPSVSQEERGTWKERVGSSKHVVLAFLLIVLVLGSIFFGLATPTEAAAVGVLGAFLLSFVYRTFGWKVLKKSSLETMKLTGLFMWMVISATIFSSFYMIMGARHVLEGLVQTMHLSPMGVILMMQLSLLLLGMLMDDTVIVLITAPLYVPLAISLGFDPVWFGVLMIVNLQVAVLTPPYGFALFYFKGIAPPGTTMMDLYRSIVPFVGLQLIGLLLCMFFPQIITWLPNLIFG